MRANLMQACAATFMAAALCACSGGGGSAIGQTGNAMTQGAGAASAPAPGTAASETRTDGAVAAKALAPAPQSTCYPGPVLLYPHTSYGSVSGDTTTLNAGSYNDSIRAWAGVSQACNAYSSYTVTPSAQCTSNLLTVSYVTKPNPTVYAYPISTNGTCTVLVSGIAGQSATLTYVVDVPPVHLQGNQIEGGTFGSDHRHPLFNSAMAFGIIDTNLGVSQFTYGLSSTCPPNLASVAFDYDYGATEQALRISPPSQNGVNGSCSFTLTGWNGSTDTIPIVVAVPPPTVTVHGTVAWSAPNLHFTSPVAYQADILPSENGMGYGAGRPFAFATTCSTGYTVTSRPQDNDLLLSGTSASPACQVTITGFDNQEYVVNVNH